MSYCLKSKGCCICIPQLLKDYAKNNIQNTWMQACFKVAFLWEYHGHNLSIFLISKQFINVVHLTISNKTHILLGLSVPNYQLLNLGDLTVRTGLVILLKLDLNHQFFSQCNLETWWTTSKNNSTLLLYYVKLCSSWQIHQRIQTGVTVRKFSIWVQNGDFFTMWPWNLMDDLKKQ